jgi:hypothetical protein
MEGRGTEKKSHNASNYREQKPTKINPMIKTRNPM